MPEQLGEPSCLVTKKDGSTLFCVNYHKVNDITLKDAYLLPSAHSTCTQVTGKSRWTPRTLTKWRS